MSAKVQFSTPQDEEFTLAHRALLTGSILSVLAIGLTAIGLPTLAYRLGRRILRRKALA